MARNMRANDGRTRDTVRDDAWLCGSGDREVVRVRSWRKF